MGVRVCMCGTWARGDVDESEVQMGVAVSMLRWVQHPNQNHNFLVFILRHPSGWSYVEKLTKPPTHTLSHRHPHRLTHPHPNPNQPSYPQTQANTHPTTLTSTITLSHSQINLTHKNRHTHTNTHPTLTSTTHTHILNHPTPIPSHPLFTVIFLLLRLSCRNYIFILYLFTGDLQIW